MGTRKQKTPTKLGRRSAFRSKTPKVPIALSVTPECVAQIKVEVARAAQENRSVWFEDVVWKIARRARPL